MRTSLMSREGHRHTNNSPPRHKMNKSDSLNFDLSNNSPQSLSSGPKISFRVPNN